VHNNTLQIWAIIAGFKCFVSGKIKKTEEDNFMKTELIKRMARKFTACISKAFASPPTDDAYFIAAIQSAWQCYFRGWGIEDDVNKTKKYDIIKMEAIDGKK
jgi:hypothetical protein